MDCSDQKIRTQNPRGKAGLFNILLFKYAFNIIYTGTRRNLKMDDIYEVLPNFEASQLYSRMTQEWQKELKTSKNPSIFKIFLRMFGWEFALWGIGIFIAVLFIGDMAHTIVMGKFMTYFEPGTNVTLKEALLYASGLIGAKVVVQLYDNTYLLAVWSIGLRMQIACNTMVYRKCLRLNSKNQNNHGRAVTIITKDIAQLLTVADCAHMLLIGFPKFFVMLYIMYTYIGVSALAGAAIVMATVPVNALLGILISKYRLKTAAQTDQRVKITQEMLTAMRIIKMHTWEKFFSNTIDKRRGKEMKILRIVYYLKAVVFAIGQLSYRFAFYVCVLTYVALGNHVTAEKAFVIIGCFGAFESLLTDYMPNGIPQMAEYKASLLRITNFLMLEEVPTPLSGDIHNSIDRTIDLKGATVTTEGATVLAGISLNVSGGLTVVAGPTGSVAKLTFAAKYLMRPKNRGYFLPQYAKT
uniref:ABC transmembrane type-1 domain-containing protein n=1 Tax=Photinus pyralis TaxID=7054 RepID=A0A1Y1K3R3_PHOPY